MQWSSRIYAHELDLDLLTRTDVGMRELHALLADNVNPRPEPFVVQSEIDKSRARDAHIADHRRLLYGFRDLGSDLARRHSHARSQSQRNARAVVPVLRVFRTLNRRSYLTDLRQCICCNSRIESRNNHLRYLFLRVHTIPI